MELSQVGEASEELIAGGPCEELDLLEDEEVHKGHVVADEELLCTKELRHSFHAGKGDILDGLDISGAVAVACGGTLDVRDDTHEHVSDGLILRVFAREVGTTVLVGDISNNGVTLSNFHFTIQEIGEVRKIETESGLHA